ncbi:MAG: hypothetical protein JNL23_13030 [Chitinophagaceae bacterium]|nr:hypothetical protein [Chitinophagaceae bacterium]
MKKLTALLLVLLSLSNNDLFAQKDNNKANPEIRQYWFVMLTTGTNRSQDSATAAKIQEGHMANISKLYYEGKLKVAGPFGDDGNWKGIFIFDPIASGCETKEEVEKLLQTDPAIAAGRLNYEIHPWWTAAQGSFKPGKPKKK